MRRKAKKTILVLVMAVAVLTNPASVLAHGHSHSGGGHHNASPVYGPCSATGCNETGQHIHGKKCYKGHSGARVTYSQCTVSNCKKMEHTAIVERIIVDIPTDKKYTVNVLCLDALRQRNISIVENIITDIQP